LHEVAEQIRQTIAELQADIAQNPPDAPGADEIVGLIVLVLQRREFW
jgi:hypothetical protein